MTDGRASRGWIAWLWLLIATIGVHALVPVGSPVVRSTGSPFSATTVDVSTAPSRRQAEVERDEHERLPGAPVDGFGDSGAALLPAELTAPPPAPDRLAAVSRVPAAPVLAPVAAPPRARAPPIS